MSNSKIFIENILNDGVIIKGEEIIPMEIRKTSKGIIFWKVGFDRTKLGSLDHILIFKDYGYFISKGVNKVIFCARSSFIRYKQVDDFINNSEIIDKGVISYKAKGLKGHSYSNFDGFKSLDYSNKFVSTMRKWEFMAWIVSMITFTPIVNIFAGILTQDSSRIIRKF